MKKKSTEKGEGYALSAHSKLAGLDFSRTMVWASKIYAIFKQHEIGLCSDLIFRRLKKILLEVYATNYTHLIGRKKLFGADVSLLKKWRIHNYRPWNEYLDFKVLLQVVPANGKVVLALGHLVLSQVKLTPRACAAAMRFYILFLDEDKDTSSSVSLEELVVPVGGEQEVLEASFTFEPMGNGVLLLLGACQLHLLDKNGDGSFASHDKNYYWANIMEAIAIKDGVVVNYEKKAVLPEEEEKVTKVGWVKRKGEL